MYSDLLSCACSPSRFVGYDSESSELEADKLRQYIFGGHVADYMRYLQDEDEDKFKAHFSRFIKEGVTADSVSVWEGSQPTLCV